MFKEDNLEKNNKHSTPWRDVTRWLGLLGIRRDRYEFANMAKTSPQDLVTDVRDKGTQKPKDTNLEEFGCEV